jgi:hypothetical protein
MSNVADENEDLSYLNSEEGSDADNQEPKGEVPKEDVEGSEDKESKEGEDEKKPKSDRSGKRIRELLRKNKELASQLAQSAPKGESQSSSSSEEDPEPDENDPKFKEPKDYHKALGAWAGRQEAKKTLNGQTEREARKQAQTFESELFDAWEDREDTARGRYHDYDEVVHENDEVKVSGHMRAAMLRTKNGPDIAYYLGKNPHIADKIARMRDPYEQATEIGQISARLTTLLSPKKTNAPKPVNSGTRRGTVVPSGLQDKLSTDEWMRRRNADIAKRGN